MKIEIYADMHNHTTASDGDFSPEKLVQKVKSLGIAVVGVTDHDTDSGLERAVLEGKRLGIKVVPGVEVSVRFKEFFFTGTVHLLCYFGVEMLDNHIFRTSLNNTLVEGRGEKLVKARVEEINKFFGPKGETSFVKRPTLKRELTFEDVASYSPKVTRRHFALALSEKHGIKDSDSVNQIIGNDSPAYLPSGVDIESIKRFSKEFDSKLFMALAHPAAGSFPGGGHYKEVHPPIEIVERLLPRFLDVGIKGIEINYPGHVEVHRKILRQWALTHNLLITGGSDCHDEFVRPPGVEGITREMFKILLDKGVIS